MCFYHINLNHVLYSFRSVTPTELNRRRHLSSTSSFDFDHMDPLVYFKELSMPRYLPESIVIHLIFFHGVTIKVLVSTICQIYEEIT